VIRAGETDWSRVRLATPALDGQEQPEEQNDPNEDCWGEPGEHGISVFL